MALLIALWAGLLFAIATASMMSEGYLASLMARQAVTAAQDRLTFEAAISRAVLSLLDPRPQHRWSIDGSPHSFDYAGTRLRIGVQGEIGRIDINQADCSLLAGLFRSSGGLSPHQADTLCRQITMWRENERRAGAGGIRSASRALPFHAIDELKRVPGLSLETYESIAPAVTVFSGKPSIDPDLAPPQVLAALPNASRSEISAIVAARKLRDRRQEAYLGQDMSGQAFSLSIEAIGLDSSRRRTAVVRLTGNPAAPFWLLDQSE